MPAPIPSAAGLPPPETRVNADGTKTVVSHVINEEGKHVRITRTVRRTLVRIHASKAVLERKHLPKFGDAAGVAPGPEPGVTRFGEELDVVFAPVREESAKKAAEAEKKKAAAAGGLGGAGGASKTIKCRICSGEHWTTRCPYKDTLAPEDSPFAPKDAAGGGDGSASDSRPSPTPTPTASSAGGGSALANKYVPPSLRRDGSSTGRTFSAGDLPPSAQRDRNDAFTLRVSNLSPDVEEEDIRALFGRFGALRRVYIARERDSDDCKGFGFVSYYDDYSAQDAIKTLDGYGYDSLILRVEFTKPKPN